MGLWRVLFTMDHSTWPAQSFQCWRQSSELGTHSHSPDGKTEGTRWLSGGYPASSGQSQQLKRGSLCL